MAEQPRVWDYPPACPPEVAAVTDRYGRLWLRFGDYFELRERRLTNWQHLLSWSALLENMAPLTDATADLAAVPSLPTENGEDHDAG